MLKRRKINSFFSFVLVLCLVLPILYLNTTIIFGSSYSAVWTNQSDFDNNALTTGDTTERSNVDTSTGDIQLTQNPEISSISTIDANGDVGLYTSVAVDTNKNIHISYYDNTNQNLKYATNISGEWVYSTLESTGDIGKYNDIAVDSNNNVHIAYNDKSNSYLKYATNASGAWVKTIIDTNVGDGWTGGGQSISIALDPSNKAHISYYYKSGNDLKYATNTSGAWVKTTVDSTNDVGLYSSIVLDSNKKVHINYFDKSNTDLKYATNVSGAWVKSTIDSTGDVGTYVSNSIDSNNKLHLAYYDKTNTNIKYASNSSGSWVKSTIENSSGDVGTFCSISVDPTNKVHISYYDKSNYDLKYATNSSGNWVLSILDGNYSGMYSSILAKGSNRLYISYYADQASGSYSWGSSGSTNGRDLKVFIKSPADYNSPGSLGANGTGLRYSSPNGEKIRWLNLRWDASIPVGTSVKAAFKTSNGDWGGSYTAFRNLTSGNNLSSNTPTPINLLSSGLNLTDSSQIEIKLELYTSNGINTPQIRELKVEGGTLNAPSSSNISIYRNDGSTNIPVLSTDGGWTNETSIRVKVANMQGLADSTTLKPEIEVKPLGISFDASGTTIGNALPAGSTGEVTINDLSVDISYHLRVRLIDNLGMASDWAYFNSDNKAITVEQTPPTGRVSINDNNPSTNSTIVSLDLSSANDLGTVSSGVEKVMVSENSNFSGATWLAYSPTLSYVLSSSLGKKNVFVKFRDKAGNLSGGKSFAQTTWDQPTDYSIAVNVNTGESINLAFPTAPPLTNEGFELANMNDWVVSGINPPSVISTNDSANVIEGNYSAFFSGSFPGSIGHQENDLYDATSYRDFVVPSNFNLSFMAKSLIGSSNYDHNRISLYDVDSGMALIKQWDTGYQQGGLLTGNSGKWGSASSYQHDLSAFAGKTVRFFVRAHNGGWTSSLVIDSTNLPQEQPTLPAFNGEIVSNTIEYSGYLGYITWSPANQPVNTSLFVEARVGDTYLPDVSWSNWIQLSNGGSMNSVLQGKKYIQYRIALSSIDNASNPQFDNIFMDMPLFMDSIVLQ